MYKNFSVHSHTPICWHKHLVLKSTLTYKHALKIWSVPPCIVCTRWAILNTHRIRCFAALKQPHWPLISVLNWIELRFLWLCSKRVFTFILSIAAQEKDAWMNAYKLSTHPLPCHLWPVQCSVVPSMLCKRSADRAVPAVSLSWRPVDTRHSAGTEVPERKNTFSTHQS